MIRIVFCDDEKDVREKYIGYLDRIQVLQGIEIKLTVYSHAKYLMANIDDWLNCTNILLLDIEMGDCNGVEVAERIREKGYSGEFVFLTVSKAYVFDSFAVNPIQYILKADNDFYSFFDKFVKILDVLGKEYTKKFDFQVGSELCLIPLKSIISFEIKKRIIIMEYINHNEEYKKKEFYMTLTTVEKKTKMMKFIKVHRAFLVNPAYIATFKSKEIQMINGNYVPIGRGYLEQAKREFCDYLEQKGVMLN